MTWPSSPNSLDPIKVYLIIQFFLFFLKNFTISGTRLTISGIACARIDSTPDPFCKTALSGSLAFATLSRIALLMVSGTGSNPPLMLWKIFLTNGKNDLGTNFNKRFPPVCVTLRKTLPCPFIELRRVVGIRLGAIFVCKNEHIHPIYSPRGPVIIGIR